MSNGALQEMFKIVQILFINYIKFVPYILARLSAGLNVYESAKSSALLDLDWCFFYGFTGIINRRFLTNQITRTISVILSNNDDDGSEKVAIKIEFPSFQTFSHLFSPLQFVKCR